MATTANGVIFSGGGGVCMIEFDTYRFAPGDELVDYAKKEIADLKKQGLKLDLEDKEFSKGVLTLTIEKAKSVGDKIINLIKQIIERIKASAIPSVSTI